MDEHDLILRALAEDASAQREIYDRHVGRIYRLCHRLCGDSDLAEDYTQETFVKAFDRLADFRGRSQLTTWLHSIAVNTTLNGLRTVQRNRQRERVPEDLEAVAGSAPTSDGRLRRLLYRAIDGLSEALRVVFVMYELEGYSHREIAEALGVEEGTSKARLSRARARLRAVLDPGAAQEGMS